MKYINKHILYATVLASSAALVLAGCVLDDDVSQASATESSAVSEAVSSSEVSETYSADISSEDISDVLSDPVSEDTSSDESSCDSSDAESYVSPPYGMLTADLRVDPVGSVPQSDAVDGSYFDDAVFIGDSISVMLSYYNAATKSMGKAQFLASGSLGSGNALWSVSSESVHPSYKGEKMRLEQSVPLTGAKKMYIMLGMNDIAVYGTEGAANKLTTLIENILAEVPDMQVYVQSMTPITTTSKIYSKKHNPVRIKEYNEILADICQQKGWNFLNVASVFADENGYLIQDYCSDSDDMGIHFTFAGCEKWVDYLRSHTAR